MKTLLAIAALGIGMVGIASCADLGFGVDVDSGPYEITGIPTAILAITIGIRRCGIMARFITRHPLLPL